MDTSRRSPVRFVMMTLAGGAMVITAAGGRRPLAAPDEPSIHALAPFRIVTSGFADPSGVAVEPSGTVLVTDRARGTLTRVDASGRRQELLNNLYRPSGVAVESGGSILIVEESRLLRLTADGLVVVASGLRQAHSLAVGVNDDVWLAVRHLSTNVIARLNDSGTFVPSSASFKDVRAIAVDVKALYAVAAGLTREQIAHSTVVRMAIGDGGALGPPISIVRNLSHRPTGLAVDAARDVFVSGRPQSGPLDPGVIFKRSADGLVRIFAAGLKRPGAMAFAANGDLIAIQRHKGRLLRFRAPALAISQTPAFTNQDSVFVEGRTDPGARVTVSHLTLGPPVVAANAKAGLFALLVPLSANATNVFSVMATGAEGTGLVGVPVSIEIVHDDEPPMLTIVEPNSPRYTAGSVISRVRAEDERSGIASVSWATDETFVIADNVGTDSVHPLDKTVTLDTTGLMEGHHSLHVVALDRAGNRTIRSTSIVVDRMAPDTLIVSGPSGTITTRTGTFAVDGSDAWTPSGQLDYSWRVDGGSWSPFSPTSAIDVTDVQPGPHRFEAKARDRAGNEDATPAAQSFIVTAFGIHLVEPASGTPVAGGSVWVRGTVEAAGNVGVSVALPHAHEIPSEWVPAAFEAGTFAVEVPVAPDVETITVMAVDGDGATASADVAIAVAPSSDASTRLNVFPAAGLAPHVVRFGTVLTNDGQFELDLESDGIIDHIGTRLAEHEFVYANPGIFVATLRVVPQDGPAIVSRAAVHVYDAESLDKRLRAVWDGFKSALISGDVAAASLFVHGDRRGAWERYWREFTPPMFAATDSIFTDVTVVEVAPGRIDGEMMREVDGLEFSFPVSFLMDVDGRWRLWQF